MVWLCGSYYKIFSCILRDLMVRQIKCKYEWYFQKGQIFVAHLRVVTGVDNFVLYFVIVCSVIFCSLFRCLQNGVCLQEIRFFSPCWKDSFSAALGFLQLRQGLVKGQQATLIPRTYFQLSVIFPKLEGFRKISVCSVETAEIFMNKPHSTPMPSAATC